MDKSLQLTFNHPTGHPVVNIVVLRRSGALSVSSKCTDFNARQ